MILIKKLVIKASLIVALLAFSLLKPADHNMKLFMPLQESFAVGEGTSKYLDYQPGYARSRCTNY